MDALGRTAAPEGATAPFSGVITRWRVRVGSTTSPVRLRILRAGAEVGRSDPGRATLLASAVYSDRRSTLGIVRVTVARFTADLTQRVRRRRLSGRLVLPAAVEPALGCRGEVTVRRRRVRRSTTFTRRREYSVRLSRGHGRVRARFAGSPVVEPAT